VNVESPLVPGGATKLIRKINRSKIIENYQDQLQIDVSEYFAGSPTVYVFECEASGYQFYYPFSLIGRESLYRHLQQFDWNYKAEKWEYDRAVNLIDVGSTVLDVGCGQGAFLTIAKKYGLKAHGLELNASAAQIARDNGLSVSVEFLSEHLKTKVTYDVVCSFQVLEHISEVHQFIEDCLAALKPGGKLIFGVPNNDSFLKYANDAILNMPPHHMGLWTRKSLTALTNIFGLEMKMIETEPLAEIDWYMSVMENRFLPKGVLRRVYHKSGCSCLLKAMVAKSAERIPGHTILALYQKKMS
jgi:2-polyprenyl-3-methyl-5-hydroxy-6-metoxy-1,4-benzoquinol methylase